jgi:PAS domain S-box-containing protein
VTAAIVFSIVHGREPAGGTPWNDGAELRLLVENARDILFRIRLGPPPAFEYVSPAVEAVTGYTPSEFYDDPTLGQRIVHPGDAHLATDPSSVERAPEGLVIRWLRKDGRVIHVESRGVVFRDRAGAPVAFQGIVRDVTARMAAEAALREGEARLRSVFAAMGEGVLIYDAAGRLVDCNASAERILGRRRDQLLGASSAQTWHAIRSDGTPLPPADYPANRTLRTGQPVRNELMGLLQPDGMVRWLGVSSEPLRPSGSEQAHGVLISFGDMTAERHAWVEVRRREAQLLLAMECAGHAFWELDLEQGELRTGERRLATAPTPDGGRWLSQVHPDDRARAGADLQDHVDGRAPRYRSEYRLAGPDGGWRWVQACGRAVSRDGEGRATRLAGTISDVTETRRLQERLRHADRLAGIGTLAAGMAHEINNPLASVSANLTVADETAARLGAAGPSEAARIEEMRGALRDAMDGAARVRGIVAGLRQFALPARGEERRPVDVKAEIEAAVGIARNEIAHRAQLRVEIAERLPPVNAAPHEMGQVLVNLLVNAAQAIPEGHAAENEVVVSARAEGGRVIVEVHDTGQGIAAADLPRVFDPFFTTKPVGAGTGLGLSMCHSIVTAAGGTIEVESPPGRGTTFRLNLPAAVEAPRARTRPAASAAGGKRGKVLVVDDELLVGKSLARLLSAHDVTVLTSPVEVLQRAAAGERWDVVLCDLMMPEMSGMELEERLASEAPEVVGRIVYLTGGAFTDRSRAFLEAGRPHLEKPVDPADLRAQVAERVAAATTKS